MSFCVKCGYKLEADDQFCHACGASVARRTYEPQPSPAGYPTAPTGLVPVMEEAPKISGKTKALGFVGMGLSIESFIVAIIGLLYTLIFVAIPPASFIFSLYLSVFSMPPAIVGRILSKKSIEGGNRSTVCTVGTRLGLAAIIISAVMVFIGFTSLSMY